MKNPHHIGGDFFRHYDLHNDYRASDRAGSPLCGLTLRKHPDHITFLAPLTTLDKTITREAKLSVFIFLGALLVIVAFAFCQMIKVDGESLATRINLPKMNLCIQIIMLCAAALNIIATPSKP